MPDVTRVPGRQKSSNEVRKREGRPAGTPHAPATKDEGRRFHHSFFSLFSLHSSSFRLLEPPLPPCSRPPPFIPLLPLIVSSLFLLVVVVLLLFLLRFFHLLTNYITPPLILPAPPSSCSPSCPLLFIVLFLLH